MLDYKLVENIITADLLTSEIKQDFFDLRDFKVISLKATVLLAFSQFHEKMLAKCHSPPQVFVHDFAISSIVASSLVTSRSNHVRQNPGLHTTLKPAVIHSLISMYCNFFGFWFICYLTLSQTFTVTRPIPLFGE